MALLLLLVVLALGAFAAGCGSAPEGPAPGGPATARAAAAPAVVWAVGDGADGSGLARSLARRIARDRPDHLLYLGDVYPEGSAADFRQHYDPVYGGLAAITMPTPGNHEWPARNDGYFPYWRSRRDGGIAPWYAFTTGGWRVLSLNSEAPHGPGSEQLRWLEAELGRRPGTCAVAFWHRPRYSAGLHGDQPDVAPLWDAVRGHARLVLNGHDHDLQRFVRHDGLTELVTGAGGRNHYPVDGGDGRLAFADDRHAGALRIELRPGRARLAFVAANGDVLDRSAARCSTG